MESRRPDYSYLKKNIGSANRVYRGIKSKQSTHLNDEKPSSVICLSSEVGVIAYRSGMIQLFNPKTNELYKSHQTSFSSIESISKYTGKEFFIGGERDILLIDTSFAVKKTLEGHGDAVVGLFVDNQVLYSASEDYSIRSWNIMSGESTILYNHESPVIAMDMSPSLKLIASSCSDAHLYIYSLKENRVVCNDKQLDSKAWSLKFLNNKEMIAIGTHDSTIIIKKAHGLDKVAQLEGHDSRVKDLEYSEELNLLISVSFDQKVLIWKNFEKIETIEDHSDWIRKACLSQDGEDLFTVGDDSKILNIKFDVSHEKKTEVSWWVIAILIILFIFFVVLLIQIIKKFTEIRFIALKKSEVDNQ